MFTEAPPSEYYAVLGVTSSMNPGKILLVSVTHIFHVKKLKHKEISSLAQESAAKKQQSRGPLPAPAQCPLHNHFASVVERTPLSPTEQEAAL